MYPMEKHKICFSISKQRFDMEIASQFPDTSLQRGPENYLINNFLSRKCFSA